MYLNNPILLRAESLKHKQRETERERKLRQKHTVMTRAVGYV